MLLSIQFGGLLYKPLWATQWWNIHSPSSTAWSWGWNIPPHHSILSISPFRASEDSRTVLLRSFQQGCALSLRRVRFSYSGGCNSLRRFRSWRGFPWTLGLRLQEEGPTALIYYLTEFGLNWGILPSGPNCWGRQSPFGAWYSPVGRFDIQICLVLIFITYLAFRGFFCIYGSIL